MIVDWHSMPPLTALRAFEAVARLGGFSAAARALNVTHAAVAQQVRSLEDRLGVALVQRDGRALALTAEGQRLAAVLSEGFGMIQTGLAALQAGENGPVRITLTASFAAQWLMPRLRDFWARHPDIALSLHPDGRTVDLRREGMDLGIRYGHGSWSGVSARRLTSARLVIVAAPALLRGNRPVWDELADYPWALSSDWPEQENWMRSKGLDPRSLTTSIFPDEALATAAARQGLGLTVESLALVEGDLATGSLVLLYDGQEDLPAYFVITPDNTPRRQAKIFIDWLTSRA